MNIYKKPHPRSQFEPLPWAVSQQDLKTRLWEGAFSQLANSYRTPERPKLDLSRHRPWSQRISNATSLIDAMVQTWSPAWSQEAGSFRTPSRGIIDPRLVQDVERCDWLYQAVLFAPPPAGSEIVIQPYDAIWYRVWR